MPMIVDKQAKKAEIIQVAIRLFARNGVVKTKMPQITIDAVIGKDII